MRLYQSNPSVLPEFRKVKTSAEAFGKAIIQMQASFNVPQVEDANLYTRAKRIAEVLSTLVYHYIDIFYARNPHHREDREFKVQVGFSVVMKKLKKISKGGTLKENMTMQLFTRKQ